jgi:hypothetical protein
MGKQGYEEMMKRLEAERVEREQLMLRMQRLSMSADGEEPAAIDTMPSHVRDVGYESPSIRVSGTHRLLTFICMQWSCIAIGEGRTNRSWNFNASSSNP